ncbi:MAG: 50S ribosomal protein L20 [Candidatus Pacebacteria bacterium]|nr:50S ribosomal protein L20 [Candidatus Paceibacterota bacterium]
MARVKRGTTSLKRRRNVLKMVKGYRFGRSTKERIAREAISKAGQNAFRDRRTKKRIARQTFTLRINAAVRENGFKNYSTFIDALKKKNIELDRKVLSTLAKDQPEVFARLVEQVK